LPRRVLPRATRVHPVPPQPGGLLPGVVTFDKRGQGLSDRLSGTPSLEERMDDVRAVMATARSDRAVLFGFSEGAAMSALFAATYPDSVQALILQGGFARVVTTGEVPGLYPDRDICREIGDYLVERWGELA